MWNTASVEAGQASINNLNIILNSETAELNGKPLPPRSSRSHAVAVNTEFAAKGAHANMVLYENNKIGAPCDFEAAFSGGV